MSKKSCEAAESIEDALLRMARVNSNNFLLCPIVALKSCLRQPCTPGSVRTAFVSAAVVAR